MLELQEIQGYSRLQRKMFANRRIPANNHSGPQAQFTASGLPRRHHKKDAGIRALNNPLTKPTKNPVVNQQQGFIFFKKNYIFIAIAK